MSEISENNKRIAKNTLVLYIRMLFSMIVSLYTSRIILQTLGADDYGIYNVVGGVVTMFSIISGSLSASISRFLTIELGHGNIEKLKTIFSTSITIQIILAIFIIILAETIGVWFLNNRLVIPNERLFAANCIFQFSIITFIFGLINAPYGAVIIAHEKMSVFAFFGIIDVIVKLIIVLSLAISPIDKLIFYGLLLMIYSFATRLIYGIYCRRNFEECSYKRTFETKLLKKMFSFAGWNFIGASSAILRDHGGNIILNLFCGPTVNAARGIAIQVCSIVSGFVSNFMVAVDPQITKYYASKEHDQMMRLIFNSAKFSFYILMTLAIPIILNIDYILHLWLGDVPKHTNTFITLVLLFSLSETLARPLITAMLATGKIRNYQLIVGTIQMMNLPISYLCLKNGYPPESVFIIALIISVCCEISRLLMLRKMIGISVRDFLKNVYLKVILVFIISLTISHIQQCVLGKDFIHVIINCILSVVISTASVYYIGCNNSERKFLTNKIISIKNILKK